MLRCFTCRCDTWWSKIVLTTFSDRDWIQNFCMSPPTYHYLIITNLSLLNQLHSEILNVDTHCRRAIPVEKRVATKIWFLAIPGKYITIARLFQVARCTVCFHCEAGVYSNFQCSTKAVDSISIRWRFGTNR